MLVRSSHYIFWDFYPTLGQLVIKKSGPSTCNKLRGLHRCMTNYFARASEGLLKAVSSTGDLSVGSSNARY